MAVIPIYARYHSISEWSEPAVPKPDSSFSRMSSDIFFTFSYDVTFIFSRSSRVSTYTKYGDDIDEVLLHIFFEILVQPFTYEIVYAK